jgi:D-sedoheptulose 7-phosphate isomerase
MDHIKSIKEILGKALAVKQAVTEDEKIHKSVNEAVAAWTECLKNDCKVLFCGNGGSAADAQHLAAELSGRFYHDREPLFAEALHVNTSYLTAVANDYSYDDIYSRLLIAKGRKGDVLVGLSTSGNSENVVRAMRKAREIGMTNIALTGAGGGKMAELADVWIEVPSKDTPRIQEVHITLGHIICELVEKNLMEG